ncbi:hypothetical protein [Stackebrandtia nassauensis]|uniref:Uncharacterized protein n=1 Tax=Stackebrandtia nassauensis (strain DSM 44728 / CIP 108903 / NRRL B-16338 / NBRC 102104 / LLR-40K-21) TaxID=446470 RepID=D3Q8Y0_STANL|nr:hypothetical protein [Stackebrandtia nassauensis]ADD40589.1 hypothetical protein Snas_0878 [Stackebrandtia nassauensis DSM 44728]
MSAIMDKAYEVQEAAAAAALVEIDGDGYIDYVFDNPSYVHDWPADPYDSSTISGIPGAFAWIGYRDPGGLPDKRAAVERGQSVLEASQGEFFRLKNLLHDDEKFSGSTVNTFIDYLDVIADAAEDQAGLADELSLAVECVEGLVKAAENDVIDIADKTIAALNAMAAEDDVPNSEMLLSVTAALIGVVGTVATGGTATAITFALISGGLSVATTAGTDTQGSTDFDNVYHLIEYSLYPALDYRRGKLEEKEGEIVDGLNADLRALDGQGGHDVRDSLDPRPGGLVNGRGNFRATGATAADLKELYGLATGEVPALAGDFATASGDFNAANGTETAAMGDVSAPWERLLDLLQRMSAKASEALYDGGTVLANAAQDFAKQDGVHAEWVNRSGEELFDRHEAVFPAPVPDPLSRRYPDIGPTF